MSAPAVQIDQLSFTHAAPAGQGQPFVLSLPSWTLPAGEAAAVVGPSGCGKSTLLNLVAGVLVAGPGQVRVLGQDPSQLNEAQRRATRIRRIGMVFQDAPMLDSLDALDNVLLPFRLSPALTLDAAARDRARGLLSELGLQARSRRRPGALSQGERQRVALARALVTQPELVLADEPTSGLDPARSLAVVQLLEGLCREHGASLILVTHDPHQRDRFERVLALEEERL